MYRYASGAIAGLNLSLSSFSARSLSKCLESARVAPCSSTLTSNRLCTTASISTRPRIDRRFDSLEDSHFFLSFVSVDPSKLVSVWRKVNASRFTRTGRTIYRTAVCATVPLLPLMQTNTSFQRSYVVSPEGFEPSTCRLKRRESSTRLSYGLLEIQRSKSVRYKGSLTGRMLTSLPCATSREC